MDYFLFETREDFRNWLFQNCTSGKGIWILISKTGGSRTVKAVEALEEALCFGWVESQVRKLNDEQYVKYFSQRKKKTEWSEKNKALIIALEEQGRMTEHGRKIVDQAKKNNNWKPKARLQVTESHKEFFAELLKNREPAYSNYLSMAPSAQKIYVLQYLEGKTEQTRKSRFEKIVERLNLNLKPT